jgi:drug/metabolite transporter (DMT)-like permease
MVATTVVFVLQDGPSRHLAAEYSVLMVVAVRVWFRAAVVVLVAWRAPAGPVLGERVGWRRWTAADGGGRRRTAVGVGFLGVLVILRPRTGVFPPSAPLPPAAAVPFALYGLLSRHVARHDPASVSFCPNGVAAAAAMTPFRLWAWSPPAPDGAAVLAALRLTGALGHWFPIRAVAGAEASAVRPFAVLQIVWASGPAIVALGEVLRPEVAVGGVIVMAAGRFTRRRERLRGAAPVATAPVATAPGGRHPAGGTRQLNARSARR